MKFEVEDRVAVYGLACFGSINHECLGAKGEIREIGRPAAF